MGVAAGCLVGLWCAYSAAQGVDKSAAVTLYDEAQRLMSTGQYSEACPKYAESNRLDPQLGVLLHLADCYEKMGKLASAWAAFRDAADLADRRADERSLMAKDRAASLESKLSRLAIVVPAASEASGMEIQRDGVVVGPALWGIGVPVDPGTHRVRVTAPGKQPWEKNLVVRSLGRAESVTVPVLRDALVPASSFDGSEPRGAFTAGGAAVAPMPLPADDRIISGHTQRLLGYGGVGLGAVGVALGVVFVLDRSQTLDDRDQVCPRSVNCEPGDQKKIDELTDEARSASMLATVGFTAGGVLAAGGVALLMTAPDDESNGALAVAPMAAGTGAGVLLLRTW